MRQWVTRQGSAVAVEPCGEFQAVYLEASAMTHLVDPVSAEVLLFLASGPHSDDAVLKFVARAVGDDALSWPELEESLLRPLVQEGMIEAIV